MENNEVEVINNLPEMSANSIVSFLQNTTKQDLKDFAQMIIAPVLDGQENPLDKLELIKKWELVIKTVVDAIKDDAKEEGLKFGRDTARFSIKNKVTYDYKNCNDPKWSGLKQQIEEREKYLQSLTSTVDIPDAETGEIIGTIKPAIKKVSEYIQFK